MFFPDESQLCYLKPGVASKRIYIVPQATALVFLGVCPLRGPMLCSEP